MSFRLRKRIRFAMPGRPLSEIQQINLEHNLAEPDNDEENTNDADTESLVG